MRGDGKPGTNLFTNALVDFPEPRTPAGPRTCHAFSKPRSILVARDLSEVRLTLEAVETAARSGAWVLGYVRYEAAPAFDVALMTRPPDGLLAWFAVHDDPLDEEVLPDSGEPARVIWHAEPRQAAFDTTLARIQRDLRAGRYYQVNYTAHAHGRLKGSARALFAALRRAQPGGYVTFMDDGQGTRVLSVSPELFFSWQSAPDGTGDILTRPMKGTAPRGTTAAEDMARVSALRESPKERAENVMIVDLLRNDLSRICQHHSVQVPRLFHAEALPTVWQMTSDVVGRTRTGTRLVDLFCALFPCGSVTGAPKVEAMRAICALEDGPRGVYCGAVGLVRPGRIPGHLDAIFNVPIRTVELRKVDTGGWDARLGIGSGIVHGADAAAEWNEWKAKRIFVHRASEAFDLLETLGLFDGVLRHREEHLSRMHDAARHFGHAWNLVRINEVLDALVATHPQGAWRVRLRSDVRGTPQAEASPLAATATPVQLRLATRPFVQAHDEFARHKTTRRAHYAPFAAAADDGVFDTILYNEADELTETTFGNLALLLDGRWVTPALACGLLPGVGRTVLLRAGRIVEAVVRLQDMPRVERLAFVNSLRGWLSAELG